MSTLVLALMMQYVVSAKAGLVNYVQGMTNVRANQIVAEMTPIRTGPNGVVEILLTPGSYLRLGPQSEAVIDNADLANVHVRITGGQAIIEVVEIDNKLPMFITTGQTAVELGDAGIFRFQDGVATVLEGKLRTAGDLRTSYKKGWQISYATSYRAVKALQVQMTSLDLFSRKRSEVLANASASLLATVRRASYNVYYPFWLYSPGLGSMTYIPLRNCRSPYGYRYVGYGVIYNNSGGTNTATNNGNSSPGTSGNNNSSNNPGNSGPTFNSSGERTMQTPGGGGRMTVGDYQDKKNPGVPIP